MALVHARRLAADRDNPQIETDGPSTPAREPQTADAEAVPALPSRSLKALADLLVPAENPEGAIYGLIVIGALLAGEFGRHESYLDTLGAALISAALYWLAHAYAGLLGGRLLKGGRLTVRVLLEALAHDLAVIRGALIPLAALFLAALAGASQETAVTIAIWSVVSSLVGFELLAGLRAKAAPRELLLELSVGAAMGVAVLGLKIILH